MTTIKDKEADKGQYKGPAAVALVGLGVMTGLAIAVSTSATAQQAAVPQFSAQGPVPTAQSAVPVAGSNPVQYMQPIGINQPPPNMTPYQPATNQAGAVPMNQMAGTQQQPLPPAGTPMYQAAGSAGMQQGGAQQGGARPAPMPEPLNMPQFVVDSIAPMGPNDVMRTRQALRDRRNAMVEPMETQGIPMRRTITLNLKSGSVPDVIRLAKNNGAVVTFSDAAGNPWPIEKVENFNPTSIDMALFGENGISIGAKGPYSVAGNFAVRLKDIAVPVVYNVATNQNTVDSAVEVQVPRYLPGSARPVTSTSPGLDYALTDYVFGTPPSGAQRLKTNSRNVSAWQVSSTQMVVVTNQMVAAPAILARNSSANGLSAFRLPLSPSITLADLSRVTITGFTNTD